MRFRPRSSPQLLRILFLTTLVLPPSLADQWPYDRYRSIKHGSGERLADPARPEYATDTCEADGPCDLFASWLRRVIRKDDTGELEKVFVNTDIPRGTSLDEIPEFIDFPSTPESINETIIIPPTIPIPNDKNEVKALFAHLPYEVDDKCAERKENWWYRTYDGSCNWMKKGEITEGMVGTARSRDYDQTTFADGISKPREGPNPRAISNAFFKRKKKIYYEHTPMLLGLVEFIMHDVTYSQDSTDPEEVVNVSMPPDETEYDLNTTFTVHRTLPVPGTGTSRSNPRQNLNMATTWLDLSSLYGSDKATADSLRTFRGGKLRSQRNQYFWHKGEYLPFNTMGVHMNAPPHMNIKTLFAGGDPRTNEDWILLSIHTLFLREHNRLCGILTEKHPEYDDERIYQTVRLLLSAKYSLIANSYQMTYWTDDMPWPRDDGFPLYRQMYGANFLKINPANTYPWPLVTKNGKPMVVSAEMAVVYRFHEFIISSFPLVDSHNVTMRNQSLFASVFNPSGFLEAGLEPVLRGSLSTTIPNFKSGVDEAFRSAGSRNSKAKYRGNPFDIVVWSIVHEREQGLPTFNQYFTEYNKQQPKVPVPVRKRFEDFTSDPESVANLKRLYKTPDEVDLVVGCQLEEELFPGTTVPKSALIISLFSLFGMGNSDRFSIGFAVMRCLLVDRPWDCHPSNALEDIVWRPDPKPDFPNNRWLDPFWLKELDFQAHGQNLLWRLVTENSDVKCLQRNPLFPVDKEKNPVLCQLPRQSRWYNAKMDALTLFQVGLAIVKQHKWEILTTIFAICWGVVTMMLKRRREKREKRNAEKHRKMDSGVFKKLDGPEHNINGRLSTSEAKVAENGTSKHENGSSAVKNGGPK